ncbi:MAG: hypothetical protein NT027_01680 [Proteobacteria bacterium]|nr:hypothetical protein [Pseudomonadota bacterium]
MMTQGAKNDPFSYGVHTGDFRGTDVESIHGSTHPENGIREWGFKNDPKTGDLLFVNRGFYAKKTDPMGSTLGQVAGGTIKNLPGGSSVDAGAQGTMNAAQSVIWESQQKDIMKYMKNSYGAQGDVDNKTFDISYSLPDGNKLSNERKADWDMSVRNSLKMKTGKPFKDDVPIPANSSKPIPATQTQTQIQGQQQSNAQAKSSNIKNSPIK